jgi:hypothetical protein
MAVASISDAGAAQHQSVALRSHSSAHGRVAEETDCVCGNLVVTMSEPKSCDTTPEGNMGDKIKRDCDAEILIDLLYLISDALHLAGNGSVVCGESTLEICDNLSNAQGLTTELLGRVSKKQSSIPSKSIVGGSKQIRKLVLVCN